MRRLAQVDNSEEFTFLIKKKTNEKQEIKLCTTLNKARVISSKINDMYQIDPTITQYELQIPKIFLEITKDNPDERTDSIARAIEQILKSTTEKIRISNKEEEIIKYILRLLGEKCNQDNQIKMNSINEAISYLSTEFHSDSVRYISEHLLETINEGQLFHHINSIIYEIMDSYFECKEANEKEEEDKINKEEKEIFDKLEKTGDPSIVIHFLLQIESHRYTKEMCEYITEHLSDEIVNNEEDQIVRQFVKHVNFLKENEKKN